MVWMIYQTFSSFYNGMKTGPHRLLSSFGVSSGRYINHSVFRKHFPGVSLFFLFCDFAVVSATGKKSPADKSLKIVSYD